MKDCYQKLASLRKKCHYSYQDMANFLKISKCYYWQIEHKKRRIYYDMAKKIADIFKLRPDEVFFDEVN